MRKRPSYSRGRWTQERERFQISRKTPIPREPVKDVESVMHAVLDYLGLDDRMWEKEIINRWQELVGPQIARHARPGRISHAVLTVFVTHSIWLDELTRYGKAEMLQKLQQCFGKEQIRDIRFALDPDMR